jgi:hypothetical protein
MSMSWEEELRRGAFRELGIEYSDYYTPEADGDSFDEMVDARRSGHPLPPWITCVRGSDFWLGQVGRDQ